MRGPGRWGLVTGALLITAGLGWWVARVSALGPAGRSDASSYGQFVLAAVGLAIMVAGPAVKAMTRTPPAPADDQIRSLALAVSHQWTRAAAERGLLGPAPLPIRWRRSTLPVAGPVSAAIASDRTRTRFDPLPGLAAVTPGQLEEGDERALHAVYGGLGSGRLLLIGPPGSGKSTVAIMLLLDALRFRDQAAAPDMARIPVPVIVTPHGWNPAHQSVTDWVAGKLAQTYALFRGRDGVRQATELLVAGRIAVFLDGLDEIPEALRPMVLTALAAAPFRLILLSRVDEAVAAAGHAPLAGAVALELHEVTAEDAARYVLQPLVDPPPPAWRTVADHLVAAGTAPPSPLRQALDTPLTLSLLRDVYGPTDAVDELLDVTRFPTAAHITNHLLDQAVTAAYTPRPGRPPPRYTVATAHRTLRYLATRLSEEGTRDLVWWQIPTWTNPLARIVTAPLALALVFGVPLGIGFGLAAGIGTVGVITAQAVSMAWYAYLTRAPNRPARLHLSRHRRMSTLLGAPLTFGLISALGTGGALHQIAAGLLGGAIAMFASGLVLLFARSTVDEGSDGPEQAWRHDRNAGIVAGLLVVIVGGTAVGLALPLLFRGTTGGLPPLPAGMVAATVTGGLVLAFLGGPGSAVLWTALASAQLAVTRRTPLRLLAFLEDARRRHLLRTVGPVYQFRHATLQDRLARPGATHHIRQ